MNFPMDLPLFRFLYWLINTAGIGGIAVLMVAGGSFAAYFVILRWVRQGAEADEEEVYAFPTSTLLGHHDSE
jgi:hypothetical protein